MKQLVFFLSFFQILFLFSQENFSKNEIIVEFKVNNLKNKSNIFKVNKKLDKLNKSLNVKDYIAVGNKQSQKTFIVKFKNDVDIKTIIELYKDTNLFRYVEPNYKGQGHGCMQTTPNDTFFKSRQWSHNNNGSFIPPPSSGFVAPTSKPNADIDTDLAWDITKGDPNLIVAVLDSGLKLDHPEFSGRIVGGYDFVNRDSDPTDDHGHGSNVAGVALATGNNSIGYAGVNWNSKVMICKVLDSNNSGFYSWWAEGIRYAVDNGAKVINLSAGGNDPSTLLEDAINYAYDKGVCVVVSTGNQNSFIQYPANYQNSFAIGSTDPDDTRSVPFFWDITSGSNYGDQLDFVAPGNYTYGLSHTSNTNFGIYWGGTSQGAPHVAGVISLILSVNPSLTISQIRQILIDSAQDQVGDSFDTKGWDQYYGHGRINAFKAITNPLLSNTEYYIQSLNINLVPNPITNNVFSITGLEINNSYDIEILTLDGKIIKSVKNKTSNGTLTFDSESMQSGVYVVNILNNNNKFYFSKKVIKP